MINTDREILITIIAATFILILFLAFILIFVQIFQHRQKLNYQKQIAIQARFEQEILQSQIEVQNDTLLKIGQELHDNIGQLLTVVKINLSFLDFAEMVPASKIFLDQANDALMESIEQVRSLSRTLDGDFVKSFGLERSLEHEVDRLKKINQLNISLAVLGKRQQLGFDKEIVLFRIAQEAINNTLKHAKATQIDISLQYTADELIFLVMDNGIGFKLESTRIKEEPFASRGLVNLRRRAASIGACMDLSSELGHGTVVEMRVPLPRT
jgi:signal transduction histidine kinase